MLIYLGGTYEFLSGLPDSGTNSSRLQYQLTGRDEIIIAISLED
jgi:hypothetical protein